MRFVNRGFLSLRNIQVSRDDMINLMSPGLKAAMHARFAGFYYSELPTEEELPDGIKIARIGGKDTAAVEWPAVTFYRTV